MVVSLWSRDFFPPLYLDPRFRPLLLKFFSGFPIHPSPQIACHAYLAPRLLGLKNCCEIIVEDALVPESWHCIMFGECCWISIAVKSLQKSKLYVLTTGGAALFPSYG